MIYCDEAIQFIGILVYFGIHLQRDWIASPYLLPLLSSVATARNDDDEETLSTTFQG